MSKMFRALKKLRRGSTQSSLSLPDDLDLKKSRSKSADEMHMKQDLFIKKSQKGHNHGKENVISKSEPHLRSRRGSEPHALHRKKRGSMSSSNSSIGSGEDVHELRLSHIAQLNRYIENLKTSVNDDNIAFVPSRMCCAQLLRRAYFQQERAYVRDMLHAKEGSIPRSNTFHHPERLPDKDVEVTPPTDRFLVYPKSYYRNCRSLHNVTSQNADNSSSLNSSFGDSIESEEENSKPATGFYISSESLAEESDHFERRPSTTCRTRHYSMTLPSVAQQNDIEIF